ncbi:MAG: hypothetical protein NC485_04160 [Ruminococcus flavefaciens]|nr:hypothetical protein [Ruminococcus flavefaciens]MCM1058957.1 hypothetical protein [Eubacterium sp.]
MDDFERKYGHEYDRLNLYPERACKSAVIPAVAAFFGACIGVLPGAWLWIIIGRNGYIMDIVGLVMAFGAVFAGRFTARRSGAEKMDILQAAACTIVVGIAVFISARIVFIDNVINALNDYIPLYRSEWADELIEEGYDRQDVQKYATDENIKEVICKRYMINDITYSECSKHFSYLLAKTGLKKSYLRHIMQCILISLGGILLPVRKISKGENLWKLNQL